MGVLEEEKKIGTEKWLKKNNGWKFPRSGTRLGHSTSFKIIGH